MRRQQRVAERNSVAFHDPDSGRTCREMQSTAFIHGERQIVTGTACREPDGSWKFVD
jgi:surface antigen